jgi:uncharacterized membrane protein YeaQ/YmgE (transglycosylase-associated protein family)
MVRANAVDIMSAFLGLGGAVFCGLCAGAFADANDLAGLFWAALGAASLSAAVRMTRRR